MVSILQTISFLNASGRGQILCSVLSLQSHNSCLCGLCERALAIQPLRTSATSFHRRTVTPDFLVLQFVQVFMSFGTYYLVFNMIENSKRP